MTLPTLNTERLTIRWLTDADVPALFDIFSDPETMRYWSSPPFPDLDAARALLADIHAHYNAGTLHQWGITLNDVGRVIGTCTLAAINREHRRAEVGFAIARAHWRRGYASEALRAMVRHAFVDLDLHRLEADADPRNDASLRCLERNGFRREGYARERYHLNGEIQDAVLLGLLRSEWVPQ